MFLRNLRLSLTNIFCLFGLKMLGDSGNFQQFQFSKLMPGNVVCSSRILRVVFEPRHVWQRSSDPGGNNSRNRRVTLWADLLAILETRQIIARVIELLQSARMSFKIRSENSTWRYWTTISSDSSRITADDFDRSLSFTELEQPTFFLLYI